MDPKGPRVGTPISGGWVRGSFDFRWGGLTARPRDGIVSPGPARWGKSDRRPPPAAPPQLPNPFTGRFGRLYAGQRFGPSARGRAGAHPGGADVRAA